jgi:hypothetical protein
MSNIGGKNDLFIKMQLHSGWFGMIFSYLLVSTQRNFFHLSFCSVLKSHFSLTGNFLKIERVYFHFEQFINFHILNICTRLSWKEINMNQADMYFAMLSQHTVKENVEVISGPAIIST